MGDGKRSTILVQSFNFFKWQILNNRFLFSPTICFIIYIYILFSNQTNHMYVGVRPASGTSAVAVCGDGVQMGQGGFFTIV